jgi:hypothetical protein
MRSSCADTVPVANVSTAAARHFIAIFIEIPPDLFDQRAILILLWSALFRNNIATISKSNILSIFLEHRYYEAIVEKERHVLKCGLRFQ